MKFSHRIRLACAACTIFTMINSASAQAPAPDTRQGSVVWDWKDFIVRANAKGARRDVVDRPTATLVKLESHITTLNPGQPSHPPHIHDREEFIILKEGVLDVHINGRVERAEAGSIFFFASNDYHNVTNVGDSPATYWVFNFSSAATKSAPAGGAAAAAIPGKLASQVFHWGKLAVKPTKAGARRDIVNSPTVTLNNLSGHVTSLRAGEAAHAAHRHPDEELVIVKEGELEVAINGATRRAGVGSIFFFASNDEHGMRNVGGTDASYYVFRVVTGATPKAPASAAKKVN